jgi:hypothetical protein
VLGANRRTEPHAHPHPALRRGLEDLLRVPEQTANPAARQIKLADFMTSKHLVIEAEGTVMLFPVNNIKYMAFSLPMLPPRGRRRPRSRATPSSARACAREAGMKLWIGNVAPGTEDDELKAFLAATGSTP